MACFSFYFNLSFLSLFFYANILRLKDWNFHVVSCSSHSWLQVVVFNWIYKGSGLVWRIEVFSFRVWWKTLLKEIWIVHLVKRHLQITFPRSMVPSNVLNVSFLFLVFLINEFCSLFSVIYMPIKSETHSELFYILYCFRTIIVYIT
jgi:hypothetical protein